MTAPQPEAARTFAQRKRTSSEGRIAGMRPPELASAYLWQPHFLRLPSLLGGCMLQFLPSQFATRPAIAQVDTDLRIWLRSSTVDDRMSFLSALWQINPHYALSLAASSQLPREANVELLKSWLGGHCNQGKGFIETFVPLVGEARFWKTVDAAEVSEPMANMLRYQRGRS